MMALPSMKRTPSRFTTVCFSHARHFRSPAGPDQDQKMGVDRLWRRREGVNWKRDLTVRSRSCGTQFCPKPASSFCIGTGGSLQKRSTRSVQTIQAMDWAKFKKASDVGFARRHRSFQSTLQAAYVVDKETLQNGQWKGAPAVTASVVSKKGSGPPLLLSVLALEAGIFRIVLDDLEPPPHERHVVNDVIMDHVRPLSLDDAELAVGEKDAQLVLVDWNTKLGIQYEPFRIEVLSAEEDKVLLTVNEQSRMKVEAFESKPKAGFASGDSDDDGRWEEIFNGYKDPKVRGPEAVGMDVGFPFARHVHGIPERTTRFRLDDTVGSNGDIISEPYRLYNLDVAYYELDQLFGLYGTIPLLIGREGKCAAGVFWHNTSETYVDVSSDASGYGKSSHWYSETGLLDIFLLPGPNTQDVFQQYLWLTGAPAMPQLFSLGYHQCRYSYMSEEDAKAVNAGFEQRDIPYDVLWLDIDHTDGNRYFTWNKEAFPDPTGLQKDISSFGRKVVTIIDPHIKRDQTYSLHQLATEQDLYVTEPSGEPYQGKCWAGASSYFDYTSARSRAAWASRFNETDYPHFTAALYVWNDMNEPSVFDGPEGTMPKHMQHAGDVEHRHVHNVYGHDMARSTYAGLRAARGGKDRPFVLTRSFFAGSQRFCAVWTGDNAADWGHLASSVPMLLSLQVCGITHCGADVGGFFGDPAPDLATRWYQAGAFQPFFRGHSIKGSKRREPWNFGSPYTELISEAIRARYELLPFWYTLMAGVTRGKDGGFDTAAVAPPMRPVSWEFPGEPDDDGRWLVGDALLVAPVMASEVTRQSVRLPDGAVWYDLYEPDAPGVRLPREEVVTRDCGLGRMFVMQRGGAVVPRLETKRQCSKEMRGDGYTVVVALDEEGCATGVLYMDDGESYEFEEGKFVLRRFQYGDGVLKVCTVKGEGGFEGCEALVDRVVVLGFGAVAPAGVEVDGRPVRFEVDAAAGVLSVEGVGMGALSGEWSLRVAA